MIYEALAPAAGPALEALGIIAGLLFVLGCIYAIHGFVHALFGWSGGLLGHVPFIGRVLALPFHKIEQHVTHELGVWEQKIDHVIGVSWHLLAQYVAFLVHTVEYGARETLQIAAHLAHFPSRRELFHLFARALAPVWGLLHRHKIVIGHHTKQIAVAQHTATHAVKGADFAAAQAATIGVRWWRTRVNTRLRQQELALSRVWKWIRARPTTYTTAAFVAGTAWALSKLGLRYLRCSRGRAIQKELCSPKGDWLLDLLQGGLLLVGTISIVELAKELQDEMKPAVDGITGLIREKTG